MKRIKRDGYEIILSDKIEKMSDCVLALGKFDGVHVAHTALLDNAKKLKARIGAAHVGAWCLSQNPTDFFSSTQPRYILTQEEKINVFFECGMDIVIVADFSKFCNIQATDFVNDHLISELSCVGVACGYDFRFGQKRTGDPMLLKEIFGGENCAVVDQIQLDGITVSSTETRKYILDGDMEKAKKFLGRPFYIISSVTQGKRLGRKLGFPTANQYFPENCIIPKYGIYATLCTTEDGKRYIGVSNVGIRPTITDGTDSHRINCETYIIGFEGDIYGQKLKVEFYKHLREERQFDSVEALCKAIANDAKEASDFFDWSEVTL